MKIYVINLKRAQDRRAKMEAQAEKLGLNLDFIEATDGQFLKDSDRALVDNERRLRLSKYPLSDNEIGCFISHRRAMQRLIDSGDRMATILEDDAKFLFGFSEVLDRIEACNVPFDFIDLHRVGKSGEVFRSCRKLLFDFEVGRVGLMHMHATSYIITRAGAEKFLAFSSRFAHVLDKEMHRYWANGLDIYGLNCPVVFADDEGFSYIDETRKENRPEERIYLEKAKSLRNSAARKFERFKDSIIKRWAFPAYVRKGRKAWTQLSELG